ncbi:MAG: hypothetical protein J5793_04575 [Clostridia bacterium]|nr:hypothetical protein [Clostridia bacterium]
MEDNTKSAVTAKVPDEAETGTDEMTEKQEKRKKIQKLIAFSLAALFVFQIIYEIISFMPKSDRYFIKNFSDHRETMEKWVDIMTEVFDAEKETHEDLVCISLIPVLPSLKNGVFRLNCFLENEEQYSVEIPAADDDYNELKNIQSDIPNPDKRTGENSLFLVVTDSQVAFIKDRYAAVYSRSGWKPKYISPRFEYSDYRITRISFHWYHVIGFNNPGLFGLYPD